MTRGGPPRAGGSPAPAGDAGGAVTGSPGTGAGGSGAEGSGADERGAGGGGAGGSGAGGSGAGGSGDGGGRVDWLVADAMWWDGRWHGMSALRLVGGRAAGPPVPVSAIPAGAPRRRLPGTVLPGLVDAHVHAALVDLPTVRAGGIAEVWDLGGVPSRVAALRDSGHPALPRIVMAGAFLTAPGGYPSDRAWAPAGSWRELSSVHDARAAVAEARACGARLVKVTAHAGGPMPAPAVLRAVVEAAHTGPGQVPSPAGAQRDGGTAPAVVRRDGGPVPAVGQRDGGPVPAVVRRDGGPAPAVVRRDDGAAPAVVRRDPGAGVTASGRVRGSPGDCDGGFLPVVVHAEGPGTVEAALAAGADMLAHTPWTGRVDDAVLRDAVAAGMTWISTLDMHGWGAATAELDVAVGNLRRFVERGGAVRYGTDLGNGPLIPGVNPREIRALRRAGLDPDEVLAAMTGPGDAREPCWIAGGLDPGAGGFADVLATARVVGPELRPREEEPGPAASPHRLRA